ncbi:uncharacterized protein LOC116029174 [Ipomoea triloba]|uniref:uncharacterized protein LOC116029174 n=1 Tax=Ipomoea triloba TaxID=35885 RepID=UPI00125CE81B|nr:uncharacterized protein LOC116029174 [Ipomoea triloba]
MGAEDKVVEKITEWKNGLKWLLELKWRTLSIYGEVVVPMVYRIEVNIINGEEVLMWKLLRRFLPFPDCLERFGVNLPSVCPFCWKSLASMEHCLFSCKEVFSVWTYFAATFRVTLSRASSIRAACHSWWLIASPTSAAGTIANLMPSFLLWQIWVSYNAAIFERTSFSSLILIQKVKREFRLLSLAMPLHSCGNSDLFIIQEGLAFNFAQQRRHTSTWIKWHKPPSGRLKLNIDASFSTSRAAGGACLRDSMGNLVMALSFPLTASSTLEAEVSALDYALNWCDLAAKRPYLIEVESTLLVRYVNSALHHVPWNIRNAVHRIQSLLDSWSSSLSHVYREANQVADSLASSCFSLSSPSLFSNFSSLPDAVKLTFLYDFRGFASSRSLFS